LKILWAIRSAAPGDLAALTALLAELFRLEADFSPDAVKQAAGLMLLLKTDGALVMVAESDGQVIGLCTVQTLISTVEGGPVGLLEDMLVARHCRRQGIGQALLQAALEWAADRGLTRLQLLAEADNRSALEFYSKCGWKKTGLIGLRKMLRRRLP
jgi:GNAT superfamily N-acetyltransferase